MGSLVKVPTNYPYTVIIEDSEFIDFNICGSIFSNYVKYDMTVDNSVVSKNDYLYISDYFDLQKYQKAFYQ
jgi:hypothetical protein